MANKPRPSKAPPQDKERTYHREDLRGDLLRAAQAYVTEKGHITLSMRTLAQEVGVSAGAPYHHFPDRRSLLIALAMDGYTELMSLAAGVLRQNDDPRAKLIEMGMSFITFATTRPHVLELMYESELTSPTPDPALAEFQQYGQVMLMQPVREALPSLDDEEVAVRVLALWSTIYGFASLRRKDMIQQFEPPGVDKDDMARRAITLMVDAALQE